MYLIRALIGRDNDKIVKVYYRISMIKKLFSSIYLLIVTNNRNGPTKILF